MRVSAALLLEKMIAEPAVSFHYCGHGDWRLHGGSMLCCISGRPVAAVTALRTSVNYPLAISCWRFFGGTNEKTRRPGAILTITTFSRAATAWSVDTPSSAPSPTRPLLLLQTWKSFAFSQHYGHVKSHLRQFFIIL